MASGLEMRGSMEWRGNLVAQSIVALCLSVLSVCILANLKTVGLSRIAAPMEPKIHRCGRRDVSLHL